MFLLFCHVWDLFKSRLMGCIQMHSYWFSCSMVVSYPNVGVGAFVDVLWLELLCVSSTLPSIGLKFVGVDSFNLLWLCNMFTILKIHNVENMDILIACYSTYLSQLVSMGVATFKEVFLIPISYLRFLLVRLLLMTSLITKKVCCGSILLVVVIFVMPSSLWTNFLPLGIDTISINLLPYCI